MSTIYKIMFSISMILSVLAVAFLVYFGLPMGVDFTGGSLIEIEFETSRPDRIELEAALAGTDETRNAEISPFGENGFLIRTGSLNEEAHQKIVTVLNEKFENVIENRFESIGPTIGDELRSKSITAIIVLLLAVLIYIAFVFRKLSAVLSPWAMGLAAIAALIHDVLLPAGLFAYLGRLWDIELSAVFVAAALTIVGYSISDSVVVFDRVRENVLRFGSREQFSHIVHRSVLQTLVRSVNTTMTTLLPLLAIYMWGGLTIKFFALALIVGIFAGAYSSIFVASPLLVWLSRSSASSGK